MKKRSAAANAILNNPGKRKQPPKPRSTPATPRQPTDLSARAQDEWIRVERELSQQGRLAEVDQSLIADHCLLVQRIDECEVMISQHGLLVVGEKGCLVKNPACQLVRQYRDQFQRSLRLLGLDPAGRDSAPATHDDDDPGGLLD